MCNFCSIEGCIYMYLIVFVNVYYYFLGIYVFFVYLYGCIFMYVIVFVKKIFCRNVSNLMDKCIEYVNILMLFYI